MLRRPGAAAIAAQPIANIVNFGAIKPGPVHWNKAERHLREACQTLSRLADRTVANILRKNPDDLKQQV